MVKLFLPLILECLQLQETSVNFAEIENYFQYRWFKTDTDVCLTFHRKICLSVASRLAIKLVNYSFLRM
jgi:hypothetical protein